MSQVSDSGPGPEGSPREIQEEAPPAEPSCPVVAFGASAGGLEAFQELLQNLPSDSGMAFVLVQHLDPHHHSLLTELLARSTPMPAVTVTDGVRIEPNHVYVIPPNSSMTITDGELRLNPRPAGQHMVIDDFFRSLAEHRGAKAIGVVLSGTASDGTLGLKAIKAAGGIAIAQDDSARFTAMPRSAIASGAVDLTLPPAGIAREIARLAGHPYIAQAAPPEVEKVEPQAPRAFPEILTVLRTATGVDFRLYKPATVQRRIQRRMALLQLADETQYAQRLREDRAAVKALFHDILINVTSFFREKPTFELLKRRVFPALLKDRAADDPVRVWVPGCSTGEEVYSTAISLIEAMRDAGVEFPVQLFGTDLDEEALESARMATYPEAIAADVSPDRLRRFFVRREGRYQIHRNVRDLCVFAQHNLVKDPPFSRLDLVSCQNVMIYFGPSLQARVLRLFHYGLKPDGYLALGLSESAGHEGDLFAPIERRVRIYVRKPGQSDISYLEVRRYEEPAKGEPPHAPPPHDGNESLRRVDQYILNRYSPAAVLVNADMNIQHFHGQTAPYLEHSGGQANLNLTRMLRGELTVAFTATFEKARRKNAAATSEPVRFSYMERIRTARITVSPFDLPGAAGQYLVVFEETRPEAAPAPAAPDGTPKKAGAMARRVKELEDELAATRHYLESLVEEQQATTEELKSANEEVQSSNEELQSTNEELLTAKEELQSTNEELTTLNEEMVSRNVELTQINNDLINLLSSVNFPIVMLDSHLRVRRFTPQAEKVLSLMPGDLGRPVSDFKPKIDIPDLERLLLDSIENLRVNEREVQDRAGRWYSLWVRPYRTTENKIDGAVMVLLDITERKQAAEARYRRLFEAAKDGILLADGETGVVLDMNPYLAKTFGLSRAAAIGRRYWELDVVADAGLDEPSFQELMENEVLLRSGSLAVRDERLEIEVVGNVYMEGGKRVAQFNIRDITERRRVEEAARRASDHAQQSQKMEAVGRLAGGVAHDFNNLLTGIMGYADLLLTQIPPEDPRHEEVEQIAKAAERASVLTRQLLAFGHKQITEEEVMDVGRVVLEMEQMIRVNVGGEIDLVIRTDPGIRPVKLDRTELEQVVLNLVINARDAMPNGGRLTVETGNAVVDQRFAREHPSVPPGDYVCLAVSDTGSGIDDETKARMFEPFYTTKPKGKGTGLGLSTIYSIVQRRRGYVVAVSELGKGTTFRIYLPPSQEKVKDDVAADVEPLPRGSETILLAEDEEMVRRLASRVLQESGYRVIEAPSGPEALRLASQSEGRIDLLLTDVVMPHMSGRELADRLVGLRPGLKVIYMSGHTEDAIVHHGVLDPGIVFVQKPFKPETLSRRVRETLDSDAGNTQ
jgi:two-component system, chemotaxis family, CheB/CheR fusion protein